MKFFWPYLVVALLFCPGVGLVRGAESVRGLIGDPFAEAAGEPNTSLPGDPFHEATMPADSSLAGDPFAENAHRDAGDMAQNKKSFLHKGWLESRNQMWLRNGRAFTTRQRLWLEGGTAWDVFSESDKPITAQFFLSGSVDFDPAAADLSADHDELAAMLNEAYLAVERKSVHLSIGKKMVRWGTGDGINPVDLINPLDHRDPLASGRSDNRLAVFLVHGSVALPSPESVEELSLELVAVPVAEVATLNAAGSAWEPVSLQRIRAGEQQGGMSLAAQDKPKRCFEDGKYGLRFTATTGGWDLGLAAYSGPKNIPVFTGTLENNVRPVITPVHPRSNAFGASFARGMSRGTLRGELAVKPRYAMQRAGVSLPNYSRRTLVEGVFGIDRTFALNRYLNLQYFAEYIPNSEDVVRSRYSHGLTFECSDLFFDDDLKLGVSGVVGFSGQGWAVQPYAEYRIGDDWLLAISFFLFHGDANERYGQFADRDFVSLRLRYSF